MHRIPKRFTALALIMGLILSVVFMAPAASADNQHQDPSPEFTLGTGDDAQQSKELDKQQQLKVTNKLTLAPATALATPTIKVVYSTGMVTAKTKFPGPYDAKCYTGQASKGVAWIVGTAAIPAVTVTACSIGGKLLFTQVQCFNLGGGYDLDSCTFSEGLRGYPTMNSLVVFKYSMLVNGSPSKFTVTLKPLYTDSHSRYQGTWTYPDWKSIFS